MCKWARAVGPPLGDTRLNLFKCQVPFKPVTLAQGSFLQRHPCVAQKDALSNVEQGAVVLSTPLQTGYPLSLPVRPCPKGFALSWSSPRQTAFLQLQPNHSSKKALVSEPQSQHALLPGYPSVLCRFSLWGSLASELSPAHDLCWLHTNGTRDTYTQGSSLDHSSGHEASTFLPAYSASALGDSQTQHKPSLNPAWGLPGDPPTRAQDGLTLPPCHQVLQPTFLRLLDPPIPQLAPA